jgi:tetratricopeptide (TPR) repeat protein
VPALGALRAAMGAAIALGAVNLLLTFVTGGGALGLLVLLAFVGWWCFLVYFTGWGRPWTFVAAVLLAAVELGIFAVGLAESSRAGAGLAALAWQAVPIVVDAVILLVGLRALRQVLLLPRALAGAVVLLLLGAAAEAAPPPTYDVRPRALGRDVAGLALENPARTVAALEAEAARAPQAPEPLLELARIFLERAAEIAEIQAIPYYYRNTGEVAGTMGGEDPLRRAEGYLDRAARLRPECPLCEVLRARLLLARDRPAEARDRLQRWMLWSGESAETLAALSAALEATGDLFGAEGLARKALTRDPGLAPAHLLLCRALLDRKAGAEAVEACGRAQRSAPPWQRGVRLEATVGLARALVDEGQFARAEEVLRTALRQWPDQARLYDELEAILVAVRRYPDAAQLNVDRLRWLRYDPDAYVHLYELYEQTMDWPAAERLYASLVERDRQDATAHYYLGLVRRSLHKSEEARKAFRQALELAGEGSQVARLARRQLAR